MFASIAVEKQKASAFNINVCFVAPKLNNKWRELKTTKEKPLEIENVLQ